ncbi:MAG: DUF502 domain-containing protein [Candidatus Omnitrophota bacterium]
MKRCFEFVKTALVGGLLVVFPIVVLFILLKKAIIVIHPLLDPVLSRLPAGMPFPGLVALAIESAVVLLGCFLVGLIAKTQAGRKFGRGIEKSLFEKVPVYSLLRSFTRRALGEEEDIKFKVALVEIEGGLVPSFIIEEHEDDRYTVFVPTAPMPASGSIYIFPREKVHLVDVSFAKAFRCITRLGAGSQELARAMGKSAR